MTFLSDLLVVCTVFIADDFEWLDDKLCFMCTSQSAAFEMPRQAGTSEEEPSGWKQVDEAPTKHVKFREPPSKIVMDDAEGQSDTKNQPYVPASDAPSSSNSPILSPVREEPSSSPSEGNELIIMAYY